MGSPSPKSARQSLGQTFAEARRRCSPPLSLRSAARALGWSKSTQARIESDEQPPSLAQLVTMARLYGLNLEEVLSHYAASEDAA